MQIFFLNNAFIYHQGQKRIKSGCCGMLSLGLVWMIPVEYWKGQPGACDLVDQTKFIVSRTKFTEAEDRSSPIYFFFLPEICMKPFSLIGTSGIPDHYFIITRASLHWSQVDRWVKGTYYMWKGRICNNVRCSVLVMLTFKLIGVRTTGTLLHYSETTWTVFGTHMSKASNIK